MIQGYVVTNATLVGAPDIILILHLGDGKKTEKVDREKYLLSQRSIVYHFQNILIKRVTIVINVKTRST